LYRLCHSKQEGNKVHKEEEEKMQQLEAVIDMLRSVVAQLQVDVHTLKAQQYLRDWTINGK
jgi:hypothetical protein